MTTTALFSDIHGNSPALRAVLADIQRAGCTRVFMLGDLINGIDPHGCVTALREWATTTGVELECLKGNGEEYLLTPDREALRKALEGAPFELGGFVIDFAPGDHEGSHFVELTIISRNGSLIR